MLSHFFLILVLIFLNYILYRFRKKIGIKSSYYTLFTQDSIPVSDGFFTSTDAGSEKTHIKTCVNCGNNLDPMDMFCNKCGSAVEIRLKCQNCGAVIEEQDKFCTNCGNRL